MDMCNRRERRNDVYVATCASHSDLAGGYTKGEHEAALDRLLADIEQLDAAGQPGSRDAAGPSLRLVGTMADGEIAEAKPGSRLMIAHAI